MADEYRRTKRVPQVAVASVATIAAAGAVGCAPSDSGTGNTSEWLNTDGAAGRINMDAVQKALGETDSPTAFEKRINEIYEGDELVLINVGEVDGKRVVEGWGDLNDSGTIENTVDDLLFSAEIDPQGESSTLKGHGANSYHSSTVNHSGFSGSSFFLGYMLAGGFSPYRTTNTTIIREGRRSYRSSPSYGTQRARNSRALSSAKSANPAAFNKAASSQSTARSNYKSSRAQTRSSGRSGSSRSGSKSGGGMRGGS